MLRIPGVRSLFEKNGWACSFEVNDYLMTPALWNNIYKGALGEVVGKAASLDANRRRKCGNGFRTGTGADEAAA